ncbi:MAG: glycosyltransferase family 39 protein [Chloroflexota bacterium]|nr:glycosyltransferase family 39 protein [Chloroflexota bacterium]
MRNPEDSIALTRAAQSALTQRVRGALTSDFAPVVALAIATFIGHMLVAGNYGYFRDELYYLVAGQRLSPGYVDFPPMIALLAALTNLVAHDALIAIHVIPALACAALVVVAGLMARTLGGSRYAQALAALATAATVTFMATGSIFSMDILDALWWSLGALCLMRLAHSDDPRWWLAFGAVAGLGLLTKLTILFFGLAVVLGALLTPRRRDFRTRWPWLGGALAALGLLPYALWNAANGWPTVQFWGHYGGLSGGGPIGFLATQILSVNPLNLVIIVAGLIFYFRGRAGKPWRMLGWAFVILYLLLTLINAKAYFLSPIYPTLYAGGALLLDWRTETPRWRWARFAYPALLAILAILLAPLAMPVLPPPSFVAHYGWLTGAGNASAGQGQSAFPQYLGDRFGWDTMTASVARAYASLPADQRAQACVFTQNYGEASALTLLGKPDHLPPVISGHNMYWIWGPGKCNGQVVLTVGVSQAANEVTFGSVRQVGLITCADCQPEEQYLPIYLCTQPRVLPSAVWQRVKIFG